MNTKKSPFSLIIGLGIALALSLFVSACNAPIKATTSPTPSAIPPTELTSTPFFTLTPTRKPNNTAKPSFTPTSTPSPTKKPSATPTATRWVVTPIPLVMETPTPLPTPSEGAGAYQLRAWDEATALELVNIAEQYSFADNIPMPFGENRFNYQDDQAVISLAAQEALHRFPEADFKEKLEWRIALANTILDRSDSDAWILQQIEAGLNSGRVTPETLDQMLIPYGFLVGDRQSAPNLFGDDRPAQVLWITRQDRGSTGLYAALSQDEQGYYILTKIYSSWNFILGIDGYHYPPTAFEIGDHTGDGVSEVLGFFGYANGSFCGFDLKIFQWQINRFVDIGRDQFSIDECTDEETWGFGPLNEAGAESIETWRSASSYTGVVRYDRYEWNGEWYAVSESRLVPPEKLDNIAQRWIVFAMRAEEYPAVIEKVQQFLSDEAQLQAAQTDFGLSYPDYLRFQLGLAYALQSESADARSVFEQIIQTPYNPLTTTLSSAAQAYLDAYHGDADLYQACQTALQVMEQASGMHPFGWALIDDFERLRQGWGYQIDWLAESIAVCDLSAAFNKAANQLDVTQFVEAPEKLRQIGVLIRSAVEVDLNNDGQSEWVLLVDTPGDDAPMSIWILLNASANVLPLQVGKVYSLTKDDAIELDVKTIISPEGATIAFIRVGEYLYVLRLDSTAQSLDQILWEMDVESYTFYQKEGRLTLEVITDTPDYPHRQSFYVWRGYRFKPIYPDYPEEETVTAAEAALLTQWEPNTTIPLLQGLLANYPKYDNTPRIMYLLGLAYELAGDTQNAVQTYWELWHNYPESAYARLAQAKLELKR
jgi:tetratricopeptide (TPR) repeat protein